MIALLGATGYIGQAFERMLALRGLPFFVITRDQIDYRNYCSLLDFLRNKRPDFLINAAGYTGKPNVDACESARADALQGNAILPLTLSNACQAVGVPWGHVSSGCIYSGAIVDDGLSRRIEPDLTTSAMRDRLKNQPTSIHGFTELDEPNFSFRRPPCSFYSGSKALGEETLAGDRQVYLWRLRIPFNERDCPRNYLSKLMRYPKTYDNYNAISHLDDFVAACLDLWQMRAAFGIYNITNPGFISTRQVVELIQTILKPKKIFEYWENDEQFYRLAASTPRSNCLLDSSKLLSTGVHLRSVEDALEDALKRWQPSIS